MTSAPPEARAQQTWNNNTPNKNWSNSASTWNVSDWWANAGGNLVFASSGSGNVTNNMTDWLNFGGLFFNSGAASFTIVGNSIGLTNDAKIENNSANTQTVSLANIALRKAAEFNPVSGNLTIGSQNIFLDGFQLNVWGNAGHTLEFSSGTVISGTGAGSTFAINQNSTVIFQSAHTYAGETFVNAGTLRFTGSGKAGNSDIRLGATSGSADAKIQIASGVTLDTTNSKVLVVRPGSGGTKTIESTATTGNATLSRNTFLDADLTTLSTSGGTLVISSSTFDLKNQTLTVSGAGNTTISGTMTDSTGAGNIAKTNAGVLTISGNNTQSGTTFLNEGTIRVGNNNALGTGGLALNAGAFASDGATARSLGNNVTLGGNVSLGDGTGTGDLTFSGTLSLGGAVRTLTVGNFTTFSGVASGTAGNGLTKAGDGTLTLSGNNTYNGTTTLSAGTLRGGNNNAFGTGGLTINGGILASDGGTARTFANNITMGGNVTFGDATGTGNLTLSGTLSLGATRTFTVGNFTTISGVVSGSTFGVTKAGTGTLALTGNNSYSGTTTLTAGTLRGGDNNAFGTGGMTINGGTLASDSATARTFANNITMGGNVAFGDATGTGDMTFSGTVGLGGSGRTLTINNNSTTLGGIVSDGGLTKAGNGTLTLTAANSYTSGTLISAGTLQLGSGGTTGSLSTGNITNNATFLINRSDNITLNNIVSGNGALNKTGAGTLVLGGVNTYSGKTTISNGAISVSAASGLGGNPGATVADQITLNGGRLNVTAGLTANANAGITVGASGGTIDVTNSATMIQGGGLGGSGALTKTGAGTLALTNTAGNYSGTITLTNGGLKVNTSLGSATVSVGNTVSKGSVLSGAGTLGAVTINSGGLIAPGNSPGTLSVSSLTMNGGGGYEWEVTDATGVAGTGWDVINVGGGTGTVTIGANSGSQFTIFITGNNPSNFNSASNYTWAFVNSGTISGFASNAFATDTSGFTGYSGSLGSFAVSTNVSGDLTLVYTGASSSYEVSVGANTAANQGAAAATNSVALFTGSAALNKLGAGTLIMTNPLNDYLGLTTIKEGTIQINANAASGSAGALGSASTAVLVGDSTTNLAAGFNLGVASITNFRALTMVTGTGSASRILSTTIGSGTAEQQGNVALNTNTVFSAASGGTLVVSGIVSGSGALTISNSGTTVLSGANTYTNTTTVVSGATLIAANNTALGTTDAGTTVNSGGRLILSNNISTSEAFNITGTGISSSGALQSTGTNTITGAVVLGGNTTISNISGDLTLGTITGTGFALTFNAGGGTNTIASLNTSTGGSLTKNSGGILIITGASDYTAGTTTTAGTLRVGNNLSLGTGTVTVNGNLTLTSTDATARDLANNFTLSSGTLSLGTGTTFTGNMTISGSVNLAGATKTISVAGGSPATISGAITNGGLTKAGAGTLALTGANTYSGGTTISAGRLAGSTASLQGAITNNSDILFTQTTNGTYSGAMSGTGTVVKDGSGTVTFSGANDYSGATTISNGTLALGNATALGTTAGGTTIVSGASLNLNGQTVGAEVVTLRGQGVSSAGGIINTSATDASLSGAITLDLATSSIGTSAGNISLSGAIGETGGSRALVKVGTGTLILSGANSYTGATTISNGTLVAANNTALGTTAGSTVVSDGATLAFSNGINSAEAITINGTGVGGNGALRNLSGANTNTGTVTLNTSGDNRIQVDSGSSLTLGAVAHAGTGRNLTVSANGTLTVTGAFTGGGVNTVVQKDGSGALFISNGAASTTSGSQLQLGAGSVTVASGTFSTNNGTGTRAIDLGISSSGDSATNTAFYANSGVTISNSIYVAPQVGGLGTRTIGTESASGTVTYNNQMYLGSNATVLLTSAGTANLVYSGNITNDSTGGVVTKVGDGTLTLSAANTWRGSLIAGAGTTILSGGSAVWDTNAVTVSNSATLNLAANETVGSITGGGSIALNANQLIAGQNNSNTEFSGIMSSSSDAATFVKKGGGVLTLSGANTVNGQLYLVAGNTLFTTNQGVGFTNIINLGEESGVDNATLTLGGTGVTLSNLVNVRSGSSNNTMLIAASNASGTSLLAGGITLNRAATLSAQGGGAMVVSNAVTLGQNQLRVTNAANSAVTIVGNISSTNRTSGELLIDGPGTTTITGNNSADLKITLGGGTLVVGALTNLGDPTGTFFGDKLNFNSGTLSVTNDITTGANFGFTMSGNGGTVLVTSGKTFKISNFINGSTNTTYTFGIGGGGTLVLRDSGENFFANTTTFAVTNNTTLQTANTLALGLVGNTALVSLNAGTFSYTSNNATMSQRFTFGSSGGTINVSTAGQALTLTNSVTFTGGLTKTGSGILEISGAKTGTGNTAVDGGILRINNASSLGTGTGTVSVASGASLEITNGINFARTLNLSGNGTVSGALLSIGGINTNSGGITLGAASTIGVSAGSLLVSGNITNGGNRLTLDTYGVAGTPLTVSGIISGNGGLTKIGGGTAVLSGANTYTNSTLIGVGTLQVGAGGTTGQLGTGAVTISNGATLNFNRSDAITANNDIDGAGNLIKSGASTLTLGGANTYSGGTLIGAGTLAGTTGSIQGSITNNGALIFDQSTTGTYAGIISGTGTLAMTNTGTVTLTNANTFSGGVTINGGTLVLDRTGGPALGGTNQITINNTGTLRTDKAGQILAPLVIVSSGGTYNLNGNNQTNALQGAGNVSLGAGTLSISNTGSDSFSGIISGSGGVTKIGAGAQTLSGANDYTGATTITAGELALGADNVIGDSSAVTINGGTFALGARAETVASLTMSSGSVTRGGGVLTLNGASSLTGGTVSYSAAGASLTFGSSLELGGVTFSYGSASTPSGSQDTIRLGGNVGYASSATGQALFTNTAAGIGAFDLGAAQRTFNLTNSGTLAASTPEMAIYWTVRDGGITKDGTGALLLDRANTHTNTTLTAGDLLIGDDAAVGAGTVNLNGGTFASASATARTVTNALSIGGDITLGQASGGTGVLTFSNANLGGGTRAITAVTNVNFVGAVTNGSLTKAGDATLALSNTGTSLANLNITAGSVAVQTNATVGGLAGSGTGALSLAGGTLTVNASTNSSFGQAITGAGGLTKTGAGTMTLTASNNFAGATLISGGTLAVNGTNTGSAVTISNGGTLGGTGLVGATTVKSGGFISPGNSIGTLAVDVLTLEGGGGYVWEVADVTGSAGTDYDLISVGGGTGAATVSATSGNPFTIHLTSYTGFTNWNAGSTLSWNIIDWGTVTGFDASAFTVNTNNFTGQITGAFTFANTNGFLVMTYTAGTPTYDTNSGTWSAGFVPALANGNNVIFDGPGGNATNDIASATVASIGNLTFSNTAGAYTLSADSGSAGFDTANRLLVNGNIVNNSANAQTINMALGFDAQRTVDAASGNIILGGTISNGAGLVFTGTSNNTVSGVVSGAGAVDKTGSGTLFLNGANTYTGATTISNGIVQLGNAAGLGATNGGTTVISGATLDLNGQTVVGETLSLAGTGLGGNGALINSSASASSLSGAVTLTGNSTVGTTGNMTLSGAVGGAFSLTKTGAATLTLSAANNYSGGTIIDAGAVMAGNNSAFGSGTITINGGGIGSTNSRTIANNLVAGGDFFMGGSTTTYGGGFDLGGATRAITFSNSATFNGVISNGGLTINGSGVAQDITFGAANTYTGPTTINGGDLILSGAGALSGNSAVNITASTGSARLDISGITADSTTIGSLAAASATNATVNLGGKTLIAGGDNTSTSFGGVISNAGSFVKTGTGTMTITRASTYTGATVISNGELALTGAGDLAGVSALNLAGATARFDISGKTAAGETNASLAGVAGSVVNLGSKNLTVGGDNTSTTFAGILTNTGSLTKVGSGTMTLSGVNTFSGGSTLSAGVLRVNHTSALGTGGLTQVDGTSTLQVNAGGTIANNLSVYNVEFVNGGNTLSGTITQNNTTYDVNAGETNTISGFVTGSGGVELIGGGTLQITGATNNYTGNTVISNGTLQISTLANSNNVSSVGVSNNITLAGTTTSTNLNASTTATIDYTGGNVTTDRAFVVNEGGGTINMATAATEMTLTGSAGGSGKLIVGEGTLILSNGSTENSFAPGSIQVDSGATLQLAANNQIGNSTGLILNGGTFRVGTASTGFSDTLGTLTLSASSTIDLGAWTTGLRQLTFANSSAITWTGTLTITNWQGVALQSSSVAEILFGTGGLTSTQLGQVYWANQNINGGTLIGGELVPVPEPRVYAAAVALFAVVGWRERKRLREMLTKGLAKKSATPKA